MAYQDCTFQGQGAFSKVFSPGVISGEIACTVGDAVVRKVKTANASATGQNTAVPGFTNPIGSGGVIDGWVHLAAGTSTAFGSERVADTTFPDPVQQIDCWLSPGSEVIIVAH